MNEWKKEVPTAPGFYWMRVGDGEPVILEARRWTYKEEPVFYAFGNDMPAYVEDLNPNAEFIPVSAPGTVDAAAYNAVIDQRDRLRAQLATMEAATRIVPNIALPSRPVPSEADEPLADRVEALEWRVLTLERRTPYPFRRPQREMKS